MNYGVDFIGINNVASVIRQSGLPLFYITRADQHLSSTPIFEVLENKSIETTVSKFSDWANTMIKGNPNNENRYQITLHRKGKDDFKEEDLQKTGVPKRERTERISFSFMLQDPKQPEYSHQTPHYIAQPQIQPQVDLSAYIPVAEFDKRLNERLLIHKMQLEIDALKSKKKEEEYDDFEEEEEEKPNALMNGLMEIGKALLLKPHGIETTPAPQVQTAGASINGHDFTDEELDRIDDAIELMREQDPNIIESLEKLAKISKDNPDQFKSLLTMLKNF